MAWRDDLLAVRAQVVAALSRVMGEPMEEDAEVIRDREELYRLASSLQIAQLLLDMNEVVLSGTGRVESTSLLEYYDEEDYVFAMEEPDEDDDDGDDDGDDDEMEDAEELRFSLFWDEATERAVDVELGKSNGRVYLLVNGEEVRQQREVLETAVLDAFRSEMELE